MKELIDALDDGRILEVFGSGTACVVCPVGSLLYRGQTYQIPTMKNGPDLAKRFHKELTDIQYGRTQRDWAPVII
ncbi:branched-chain-amino-acid aminotransferase, cytosolic-like [Sinocyclocheilus grahami]|uniref:branched-chain-amino-acid aminotransferase, cytosolic-like n=2 Tax=Cyprininae TaxID=2743694 RepID=UPI0007AD2B0D|nr:PREDICTED: branched-chain-amino-acid aminotransferase, cytosolic-like [Sinocyclocheilus grahami]